jgi:cation diffusion facilitator CzcD-associated flavoprotein CzcO
LDPSLSSRLKSDLVLGFTPRWSAGCRRITPGDPYLKAIEEDNVQANFPPAVKVTPTVAICGNGTTREVDTIIYATRFNVSFKPCFLIIGRNGVLLGDKWNRFGSISHYRRLCNQNNRKATARKYQVLTEGYLNP